MCCASVLLHRHHRLLTSLCGLFVSLSSCTTTSTTCAPQCSVGTQRTRVDDVFMSLLLQTKEDPSLSSSRFVKFQRNAKVQQTLQSASMRMLFVEVMLVEKERPSQNKKCCRKCKKLIEFFNYAPTFLFRLSRNE